VPRIEQPRAARERAMDRPMPLVAPLSGIRLVDWLTEEDTEFAQVIGVGCVMLLQTTRVIRYYCDFALEVLLLKFGRWGAVVCHVEPKVF